MNDAIISMVKYLIIGLLNLGNRSKTKKKIEPDIA